MQRIIIVGYKSFIQENLYKFFKKKNIHVLKIKFNNFNSFIIKNGDRIINCSNSINFFKKKYNLRYDRNYIIAKKISKIDAYLYILSTRQVYKPRMNITEKSYISPINTYAKNNLISEKKCNEIIGNKLIILRLSNIVGMEKKKKRPSLMSILIKGIRNKVVQMDENYGNKKDILPVRYLSLFIFHIIRVNFQGIVNIGSGVSLTLMEIYKYLDLKNSCKLKIAKSKKFVDSSYSYNLKKLYKIIKIKISKKKIYQELDEIRKNI